jgi:hypothetical protein
VFPPTIPWQIPQTWASSAYSDHTWRSELLAYTSRIQEDVVVMVMVMMVMVTVVVIVMVMVMMIVIMMIVIIIMMVKLLTSVVISAE